MQATFDRVVIKFFSDARRKILDSVVDVKTDEDARNFFSNKDLEDLSIAKEDYIRGYANKSLNDIVSSGIFILFYNSDHNKFKRRQIYSPTKLTVALIETVLRECVGVVWPHDKSEGTFLDDQSYKSALMRTSMEDIDKAILDMQKKLPSYATNTSFYRGRLSEYQRGIDSAKKLLEEKISSVVAIQDTVCEDVVNESIIKKTVEEWVESERKEMLKTLGTTMENLKKGINEFDGDMGIFNSSINDELFYSAKRLIQDIWQCGIFPEKSTYVIDMHHHVTCVVFWTAEKMISDLIRNLVGYDEKSKVFVDQESRVRALKRTPLVKFEEHLKEQEGNLARLEKEVQDQEQEVSKLKGNIVRLQQIREDKLVM